MRRRREGRRKGVPRMEGESQRRKTAEFDREEKRLRIRCRIRGVKLINIGGTGDMW
jgi:hypothetical protein